MEKIHFKNWDGTDLKGQWLFTLKIDGVQARMWREDDMTGIAVTKGGNKLHNMPLRLPQFDIAEVFCGSWSDTMKIVRAAKSPRRAVKRSEIFPLFPKIDKRLVIGTFTDPDARLIKLAFEQAIADEHEGLVLHGPGHQLIKVKSKYSEDVRITGFEEGKGKYKGMLGKFLTERGGVGAGLSDASRKALWSKFLKKKLLGKYIEVEAMSITPTGKFRHPRFIRLRLDK